MERDSLFNAVEAVRRKEAGVALAAGNRTHLLAYAKGVARDLALRNPLRETNADEVQRHLHAVLGAVPGDLGPAAGSLFRGKDWEFTGKRIRSVQVRNHCRELKVWRLRGRQGITCTKKPGKEVQHAPHAMPQ